MELFGISALVTGANRGLGQAFATELLARGVSRLYAAVRRPADLAAVFPDEPRIVPLTMDVTDLTSVAAAAAQVPKLGLLVNNAAVLERGELLAPDGLDQLERTWRTNVRGPLAVTRALLPALGRAPAAAVVQVAAIAALCPLADVPVYASTKAAALSLTQGLRRELAPLGLPVYAVLPGAMRTEMAVPLRCPKADPRAVARRVLDAVAADLPGEIFPDAVAAAVWKKFQADPGQVLFVAPPAAPYNSLCRL